MRKYLKFFAFVLCSIIVLQFSSGVVLAETNDSYFEVPFVKEGQVDEGGAADSIAEFIINDVILENVGRFILSLSTMVEALITNFSKWLFKINAFPWEDYIVYNSLPYLDVNFFSYSNGSIFSIGEGSTIGDLIRNIYFTLLTFAVGLLGLGVAITAIRLSISTIAAEKAKYKEAITKCLYTVIMLFSIHFLISFIFYTNETIVEAASGMLGSLISAEEKQRIEEAIKAVDISENIVFVDLNAYPTPDNPTLVTVFKGDVGFIQEAVGGKSFLDHREQYFSSYYSICDTDEYKAIFATLKDNGAYLRSRTSTGLYISPDNNEMQNKKWYRSDDPEDCTNTLDSILYDVSNIKTANTVEELEAMYSANDVNSSWFQYVRSAFEKYKGYSSGVLPNVISSLGEYFKLQSEDTSDGSLNYIAITLYAILIVQSIMLLISYIKRVFYVTLLALLAPVVVIYDFFMSAI